MRKFLFFAIALITSATMMAAGGDGSSRSEAIHFEWDGTNTVEANSETWYCLGLSDLSEKARAEKWRLWNKMQLFFRKMA